MDIFGGEIGSSAGPLRLSQGPSILDCRKGSGGRTPAHFSSLVAPNVVGMAYPLRLTQRTLRPTASKLSRYSSAFRHSARLKLATLITVSCLLFLYSSWNRYGTGRRRRTLEDVSRFRPLFAPNQPLLPSPLADLQPVSAYLDSRPAVMDLPPKILLLAVADTLRGDPRLFTLKFDDNFSCAVRVQRGAKLNGRDWEDVEVRMIRATVELLDDHHLAPIGAAWVDCEGAEDGWFAPDIHL